MTLALNTALTREQIDGIAMARAEAAERIAQNTNPNTSLVNGDTIARLCENMLWLCAIIDQLDAQLVRASETEREEEAR